MPKLKYLPILISTVFCFSCKKSPIHKTSEVDNIGIFNKAENPNFLFHIDNHKNKFKFKNLPAFSIDSINWNKRKNHYHKLTEEEFFTVYQDSSLNYQGGYEKSIDLDFFYSLQSRNSEFTEITILWQREGEYCEGITYFIFDKKGKLLDQFLVSGSCGDGGYYDQKFGRFLNDSIYKMEYEDYNEGDYTEFGIKKVFERTYAISKKGKVKMTEKLTSIDTLKYK